MSALIAMNGKIQKINARLQYTSWHPSGRLAVYSINNVGQCFHMTWKDIREVFDHTSRLLVYNVEKQRIIDSLCGLAPHEPLVILYLERHVEQTTRRHDSHTDPYYSS